MRLTSNFVATARLASVLGLLSLSAQASLPQTLFVTDVAETVNGASQVRVVRTATARFTPGLNLNRPANLGGVALLPESGSRRAVSGSMPAGGFQVFEGKQIFLAGQSPVYGSFGFVSPDQDAMTVALPAAGAYPVAPSLSADAVTFSSTGELIVALPIWAGAPSDAAVQVTVAEVAGGETIVYRSPGLGEVGAVASTRSEVNVGVVNPNTELLVSITRLVPVLTSSDAGRQIIFAQASRASVRVKSPARGNNLYVSPSWPSDERLNRGTLHEVAYFAGSDAAVDTQLYPTGKVARSYPTGTYRLLQNGVEILRSNRQPFTLDTRELAPLASYQIEIESAGEKRLSRVFTLEVIDPSDRIRVVRQPSPNEAAARALQAALVLQVDAIGPNGERFTPETFAGLSPVTYRWFHNGEATGFEGPQRVFASLDATQVGDWSVSITAGGQTLQSEAFAVTLSGERVVPALTMTNLSARAESGDGENLAIIGAVTTGAAELLVRHVGPTLQRFGVTSTLANPSLHLFHDGKAVAQNNDWRAADGAGLARLFQSAGAFALDEQSGDAALTTRVEAGLVTAHMTHEGTVGGTSLVELYALSGAPVRNLSVRGKLARESGEAIVGFTLSGAGTRRYLLRAMGEGLNAFGLRSTLDPKLSLMVGRHTYDANQTWTASADAAAIAQATQAVGAVPFASNTGESALLVELSAGAYTLILSREGAGEGAFLVELWEVP